MSNTYGKILITSGDPVIVDVGGAGLSGVLIGNVSGLTCVVELQGATVKRTLYPGTADFFEVPPGRPWTGNLIIDPVDDLTNTSKWPGSFVRIDTFGTNERPRGTYPISLNLTNNVGNAVDTNVSATDIVNENNPAGTNVVRAKQVNSTDNNILMLNDGNVKFGQYIGGGYQENFELISAATPLIKLGKNLVMQGRDSAGTLANIFGIDGGGRTFLQSHSAGDQTVIYDASGNYVLKVVDADKGLDIATTQDFITGTTAGAVRYYMPFVGPVFKGLIVFFDNYRNASAVEQTLALPVAFTQKALVITNNTKPITPYNAGSALVNAVRLATSIGVNGFGMNIQSVVTASSLAFITSAFDALGFGISQAGNTTDIAVIVGF